jgi:general stress protein YciG
MSQEELGVHGTTEYYVNIGKRGGRSLKEKRGIAFFRKIGALGGNKMLKERGSEFFREIGARGGKARAEKFAAIRELNPPPPKRPRGRPRKNPGVDIITHPQEGQ